MSCNDKGDVSREDWQSRLETFQSFKQDDINKLIMNYLVTGNFIIRHWRFLFVLCKHSGRAQGMIFPPPNRND